MWIFQNHHSIFFFGNSWIIHMCQTLLERIYSSGLHGQENRHWAALYTKNHSNAHCLTVREHQMEVNKKLNTLYGSLEQIMDYDVKYLSFPLYSALNSTVAATKAFFSLQYPANPFFCEIELWYSHLFSLLLMFHFPIMILFPIRLFHFPLYLARKAH